MQVILLAAGRSTRLEPLSDKNTLEFSGKTLVEHQVAMLKKAKLRDIVVVGGAHNLSALKKALKDFSHVAVVEQKQLDDGMAGGVLAGAVKVNHKNVLVVSTNDVVDPGLFERVVSESKDKSADGVIVGKSVDSYFPGGYLKFDKHKWIETIVEKPGAGKEPSNWVNMVIHVFNDFPAFVKRLKNTGGKADGRYEKALTDYIKKDKAKLKLSKYVGPWLPIKFPWHVLGVMRFFLENQVPRIDKTAEVAKTAVIEGNVVIGPKVKIMHNAVIKGPAYIGSGSVVGTNAFVRESMVGQNSVIGFGSEVTRSYLSHHVWTHNTYVGDSVVDNNVSFGAGTVLGNLRFDEKNVKVTIKKERIDSGTNKLGAIIGSGARFGINSSTNPGIKIGKNALIGGSLLVDSDVEDGTMVILQQKLVVKKHQIAPDNEARKKH